jgi:AcrR family transcriptional regulator
MGVAIALDLFLEHGFEGVSLFDFKLAFAIDGPSFYAAFESKEGLFAEALSLYRRRVWEPALRELEHGASARDAVLCMLRSFAAGFSPIVGAHGCLVVWGAANCAKSNLKLHHLLQQLRSELAASIQARLARGIREGDLAPGIRIAGLTAFCVMCHHGLAVQAHDRVGKKALLEAVEHAMTAWPS